MVQVQQLPGGTEKLSGLSRPPFYKLTVSQRVNFQNILELERTLMSSQQPAISTNSEPDEPIPLQPFSTYLQNVLILFSHLQALPIGLVPSDFTIQPYISFSFILLQ